MLSWFEQGWAAVDPERAVERALHLEDATLTVGSREIELADVDSVYVIGAGKAVEGMARALEFVLGHRLDDSMVVTERADDTLDHIELREASHPRPDERSMKAGERALELARRAGEDDLVVAPISGGGSALLERPVEAIGLESLRQTTELLLASGEPIQRINAVRKHLSAIKGGQLARALSPARCVTLLVSDVVGDRLDTIASGPTAPDETTYGEALEVLEEAELSGRIPDDVFDHLQAGARGEHPETPDEGDPVFDDAIFEIVASRREALEAIEESARSEGYRTEVFTTEMAGEAREVAREIVARLDSLVRELDSDDTPVCLLACGETTVTVTGSGRGGRNQELALAAAIEMERRDLSGETLGLAALATDGIDGPTDAAGAIVDASTIERGRDVGLDALDHLERNDSYAYLDAVGELVRTGPTGTNVNDLVVGIVQPEEAG